MEAYETEFESFVVTHVRDIADRVKSLRFEPTHRRPVVPWAPGAHLDFRLGSGLVRQYSLCGEPSDDRGYTVGILLDPASQGGSEAMHRLAEGDTIEIRGPRNNFELVPASQYLFFAGGIGITPILAMVRSAAESAVPWRLVYGGRNRSSMAFQDELRAARGGELSIIPEDTDGRADFARELSLAIPGTAIYACGPAPMLDALAASCSALGLEAQLHVERFKSSGEVHAHQPADGSFEVELARTGEVIPVSATQSIVDAILPARPNQPYSCLEGYCGTCETKLLLGEPDHRDEYLSDDQKAANDTVMLCVSRAKGRRLVLDL
ncbi:PDR/VanB family oxidoreductase [Herbiconiux sp. CPCC 203407]|uniref:PDR/VanB family oxidoreductase n=1 Tax=Herbiconiux oxytropis TaxID=2970915 RepID=A0AA42BUB3_9MICO|nr:PDR/VanB family oxidoreductase [Herbiconiux oxytropis]MCS5721829.1 PDR/VanB family oxidoreductase [Herbiconiux oxytropis]MCS5727355.1 PDR/VanB family oxidoreductase [Herbiconiux oxytropis]